MISAQAISAIEAIFAKAARNNLALAPGDDIQVERLPDAPFEPAERHLFIFTIASFQFKLLIIFHIDSDPLIAAYFNRSETKVAVEALFPEVGNMCCGEMNRDLGCHFPHLGMSTPYQLDRQCASHLDVLRPGHVARHRITLNNAVSLHATLCLRAYAPVDFVFSPAAQETGTIELF
ncbi:MAG: hypothetical protein ACD_10C00365G0003 [uncultured bacterium]|nr:MAG: hypothetical protein ACD_10C00365G0003 [uncultured bacterium]